MGLKLCVRTTLKPFQNNLKPLETWCSEFNLFFERSTDDFLYIASDQEILQKANALDHSYDPHEEKLGELLGYPACCCRKIAAVGEMQIDAFEDWLITQSFNGPFKLIRPHGYREGKAFISHVPCSTSCFDSLNLAKKVVSFLIPHEHESILEPWIHELKAISDH